MPHRRFTVSGQYRRVGRSALALPFALCALLALSTVVLTHASAADPLSEIPPPKVLVESAASDLPGRNAVQVVPIVDEPAAISVIDNHPRNGRTPISPSKAARKQDTAEDDDQTWGRFFSNNFASAPADAGPSSGSPTPRANTSEPKPLPPAPVEQPLAAHGRRTVQQPLFNGWTRVPELRVSKPMFVRFALPDDAEIVVFGAGATQHAYATPVTIGLRDQHLYAFALEQLPDLAGRRFYGTVEVVRSPMIPQDMKADNVAVPIDFDESDLDALRRDRMITKFMVLEDVSTASAVTSEPYKPVRYDASYAPDVIKNAKDLGNIVLVVRVGNRVPSKRELAASIGYDRLLVPRNLTATHSVAGEHTLAQYFVGVDSKEAMVVQTGFIGRRRQGRTADCDAGRCGPGCPQCGGRPMNCFPPRRPTSPVMPPLLSKEAGLEYLCDGGDQALKAWISRFGRWENIDAGDTVVSFRNKDGRQITAESNRVCVYAPRYVELRVIQGVDGLDTNREIAHLARDLSLQRYRQRQVDSERKRYLATLGVRSRSRASGFAATEGVTDFYEVTFLDGVERVVGLDTEFGMLANHHVINTTEPHIAKQIAFAVSLSYDKLPQIIAMTAGTGEMVSASHTAEVSGEIERPVEPSRLKIVKRASVTNAKIGDEVGFEIHYSHTGEHDVSAVSVIDSLPARLEYVPKSAESSRDAVFTAEPNDVGSTSLRWDLKNPLKPGEDGVVKFRAAIR